MGEFAKLDPLLHSELRLALRGRVHLCRERFCGEEAADGVQDYRDGVAGFRCIRRGLEVVSALTCRYDFASLYLPIPKPLPRKGLRSLSLRVLIPSTPSEGVKGAYHNGTKSREMLPLWKMDEGQCRLYRIYEDLR